MRPGIYLVTAEKSGFALALVENVVVQVGARLRVDLQMPIGQVTEKVEVTASSPLLETDSSQRGQVISGDQTRALPLLSREYSSLALLTTGVKLGGSSLTTGNTPREGAFNVNGLRSTFNNFLIDGVDNNAYGTSNQGFSNQVMQPSPDAIGEFKVVTNNMSAEYGRAAGATINVNYRSGTNALHGSGWEFLRDTSMNATGFFKPATGKPELDRHQFGGVLGGPIVRNKAFFFADYEGLRQTRRATGFATHRDAGAAAGHPVGRRARSAHRRRLSGRHGDSDDRLRAQGAVGAARHEPARQHQQLQHAAGVHRRLQQGRRQDRPAGEPGPLDVRPLRLPQPDHRRSAEHPAAVRRRRQRPHLRAQPAARRSGRTWVPTTTSLLEVRFGYSWTQAGKNPPALGTDSALDQFGLPGLPSDSRIAGGLPTQVITGYSDLGRQATNPQWQYPTVYNPKVNYTWTTERAFVQERLRVPADRHRSAGRESALRPRHLQRPVHAARRRGGEQPLQPRRLHARPARAVRAQQRARRQPAPQHALRLPAGRLARDAAG